jgi:hypothetical protein
VVKRAYVGLRERASYLKRLAFYTMTEEEVAEFEWVHLTGSKPEDIDVVVPLDEVDLEAMRRALDCYVTYAATIDAHQDGTGIKRNISRKAVFELYQEAHDPPLESLFDGLKETE